MNYDLCSGTCLKKSGIYSVAMFQRKRRPRGASFALVPEIRIQNAAVQWTAAGRRLDGGHTTIKRISGGSPTQKTSQRGVFCVGAGDSNSKCGSPVDCRWPPAGRRPHNYKTNLRRVTNAEDVPEGRLSVSKKSFRHAVRIFKLSKKFKNTCRLNAKGAFCPLHTSPAALSQTSSARFFDSLIQYSRPFITFV